MTLNSASFGRANRVRFGREVARCIRLAFLLTPGTRKGVQRLVPVLVNDVSNASLFLFRIKSLRLHGRRLILK